MMIHNNLKQVKTTSVMDTVIGNSSMFIGTFTGQGNMAVNGIVEGEIAMSGVLNILPTGRVRAAINALACVVAGSISGTITAKEEVSIEPTAKAWCDIKTSVLTVAPGATFKGNCID